MKQVTVYTVSKDVHEIPEFSPHIEMVNYNESTPRVMRFDDSTAFAENLTYDTKRIPVERVCENFMKNSFETYTSEKYIAIDKDLKDLFSLEWRQKHESVSNDLTTERKKSNELGFELENLQNQIDTWWIQPWYKRVWSALWG